MELGDCLAFPTSKGKGINAYFPNKEADRSWRQDAWGAGVVCELGRAFGYLAWYRLCVINQSYPDKPTLDDVLAGRLGAGLSAGTCSPTHFKRMELEKIGALPADPDALHRLVPDVRKHLGSGDRAAILDISICNNLQTPHARFTFKGPLVRDILAR